MSLRRLIQIPGGKALKKAGVGDLKFTFGGEENADYSSSESEIDEFASTKRKKMQSTTASVATTARGAIDTI